jgi:hypothetical protein
VEGTIMLVNADEEKLDIVCSPGKRLIEVGDADYGFGTHDR